MIKLRLISSLNTDANDAYKLRYKIFHDNHSLIGESRHQVDLDVYDRYAKHFIVMKDEVATGVGRVLTQPDLQFKDVVTLYPEFNWLRTYRHVAELSRFGSDGEPLLDELMSAALIIMLLEGKDAFVLIMERRFALALKRRGITLTQVGDFQKFHGTRAPYLGYTFDSMSSIRKRHPIMYVNILNGVANECKKM